MAVELEVANPNGALAPPASIVTTTERSFVIRARNGKAEYVNVSRGAPAGELIEVLGALAEGDEIVRRASDEIREGAPLSPKPAAK